LQSLLYATCWLHIDPEGDIIATVAILSAIALPSYKDHVICGKIPELNHPLTTSKRRRRM
jgi:hypothetical protein